MPDLRIEQPIDVIKNNLGDVESVEDITLWTRDYSVIMSDGTTLDYKLKEIDDALATIESIDAEALEQLEKDLEELKKQLEELLEGEGLDVILEKVNALEDKVDLLKEDMATKEDIKELEDKIDGLELDSAVTSVNGKVGDVVLKGDEIVFDSYTDKTISEKSVEQAMYVEEEFNKLRAKDREQDRAIEDIKLVDKSQSERIDGLSEVVVESGNSMSQSIQELRESKADIDKVVTSVNGQTGDVVIEGGGGSSEYLIPRETTEPIENEIYMNTKTGAEFEYVTSKEGEVTIEGNKVTFKEVRQANPTNKFKIKIVNGSGKLKVNFKDLDGKSFWSAYIIHKNGDTEGAGWSEGSETREYDVVKGDKFVVISQRALEVTYEEPTVADNKTLLFEGEELITDLTDVYTEISTKTDQDYFVDTITTLLQRIGKNQNDIGPLMWLETEAKDNLVAAINEVNSKGGGSGGKGRTATIVIANYDSHENSKESADILIDEGENAAKKINDAIQSLKGIGGEVKLMEGTYNLQYGIVVNVPNVHLTGIPGATILKQNTNWGNNPIYVRKHIVDTKGLEKEGIAHISNLIVDSAKVLNSYSFYCDGSSQVINCISNNSGSHSFYCDGSSQVINCVSNNSSSNGFNCSSSSRITNCISNSSGGYGFNCSGSSRITNCISNSSGSYGFYCDGSSQTTNCISNSSSSHGFYCRNSSKVTNCTSNKSGSNGFHCWESPQVTNCTSNDSNTNGFHCDGSSQVTNCTSNNSARYGFHCRGAFNGICSFNTLKSDTLKDDSSTPAIVEYNIIQEVE